jgi:PQQ-dependent dehydrogenase (methanol/ethanol family)
MSRTHRLLLWTWAGALSYGLGCSPLLLAQNASDTPVNPVRGQPAAIDAGRKLFNGTCAVCHGVEASGGRGPALNTGRFAHGGEDHEVFNNIKNGIGSGGMPSFAGLADGDVWAVVSFLKSLSASPAADAAAAAPLGDASEALRGKALFFGSGGCARCHETADGGSSLAADLSAVGRKGGGFIRSALSHESIHEPPWVQLTLSSGETVGGIVKAEDAFNVLMLTEQDRIMNIERTRVRSVQSIEGGFKPSVAPSAEEAGQLVAYLSRQLDRGIQPSNAARRDAALSAERIVRAANEPQSWLTYWGDYAGHHFSALAQIDTSNVNLLQAQWAAALPGPSLLEATPIVVDGVMYVAGSPGDVYALDAKSGLQIWKFSRKQDAVNPNQINPYNRGVAVLNGRVYVGTLDDLLIAIDAHTGRELWERRIANTLEGYTITGAPLVLKDLVVVGVGCGEYGVRGFLEAFDAATGESRWRLETIPGPKEAGHESWAGDSWKRGGGGTWLTGSYDPSLNLLYWAVGNPAPYNNWKVRQGDNLHTDSVLAINPDTGTLIWAYQFTPNDSHDWDSAQDMILADRVINGKTRKVLIHADRNGFLYVLDRTNGEFISGHAFVRQTWNEGFDAKGRPRVSAASVATPQGQVVFPTLSATNFQAPSFDSQSGRMFLAFRDTEGFSAYGEPDFEPGKLYTAPSRLPRPKSTSNSVIGIRALAVDSGKIIWSYPLPQFAPQAGVLATNGGVVFAASADGSFVALNADSGTPLWHFRTAARIFASPISYALDGRQFIAIAAGNVVYSFALPQGR